MEDNNFANLMILRREIRQILAGPLDKHDQETLKIDLSNMISLLLQRKQENDPVHADFICKALSELAQADPFEAGVFITEECRKNSLGGKYLEQQMVAQWDSIIDSYAYINTRFLRMALTFSAIEAVFATEGSPMNDVAIKKWGTLFNRALNEDVSLAYEALAYIEDTSKKIDQVSGPFGRRALRQTIATARQKLGGGNKPPPPRP